MPNDMVMNGPAEFDMQVFLINDETGQEAKATVGLGIGEYPTKKSVAKRVKDLEENELTNSLQGFRLMTRKETLNAATREKTGQDIRFACPNDWDPIEEQG